MPSVLYLRFVSTRYRVPAVLRVPCVEEALREAGYNADFRALHLDSRVSSAQSGLGAVTM